MPRRRPPGKVDGQLKKAVKQLLTDVMDDSKVAKSGKPMYSLTDKMKVIAAATKIAAIEAKVGDDGYGGGFSKEEDD